MSSALLPVVEHAGGSLPRLLGGDDRLRAHESIRALTAVPVEPGESVAPEVDDQVLGWVMRDPSLFVERIPETNSHAAGGASSWSSHRTWWGTLANKLATIGCFRSTVALFEAGAHPDDGNVFTRRVIWQPNWNSDPVRLAAVLKHGANPDIIESIERPGGFRADPNNSVIRTCLQRVGMSSSAVWDEADKSITGAIISHGNSERLEAFRSAVECVNLLLRAGARRVDPVEHDVLWDDGDVRTPPGACETAVGMLVQGLHALARYPHERELLVQLCTSLRALGADVDQPSGPNRSTPCAVAIKNRDIETFRFLLRLGANAAGSDAVYQVQRGADEAAEAEFRAQVMEAVMQRAGMQQKSHWPGPAARRNKRAAV